MSDLYYLTDDQMARLWRPPEPRLTIRKEERRNRIFGFSTRTPWSVLIRQSAPRESGDSVPTSSTFPARSEWSSLTVEHITALNRPNAIIFKRCCAASPAPTSN